MSYNEDLNNVREILENLMELKDRMLTKDGIISINQLVDKYLKENPDKDPEYIRDIVRNTHFKTSCK